MSQFTKFITKEYKGNLSAIRDDIELRKDKSFFWPTGTQVYCGLQGSGKTISAVEHIHRIKERYPDAILVSNVHLTNYDPRTFDTSAQLKDIAQTFNRRTEYILFSTMEQLSLALVAVNNGHKGVIYLIDEIHTYFNALDSKNIPMYVFTEISQQRKQRKTIIGTSQLFLRLAKPFREQCDNVIMCKTIASYITLQTAWDGATLTEDYNGKLQGNKRKTGFFIQTRKHRKAYDTYQKVTSGIEQYQENQVVVLEKSKKFRR